MKKIWRFAVASVVACLVLVRAAVAQTPSDIGDMMRQMQYGPMMILMRREAQKELKLDKKQNDALKKLQKEWMDEGKNFAASAHNGGSDPSQALALSQQMRDKQAEYNKKALELLIDDQRKRLSEIRVQMMGFQAVLEPEAQTALALTDEQKASVSSLSVEYQQAKMDALQSISRNPGGAKNKMKGINDEYKEKVAKILTAEQNAKWKELEGAPFKDIDKFPIF